MSKFTVVFDGVLDGKKLEDFTINGATAVAYWNGDAIIQRVAFQDFIAEIEDLNDTIEDLNAERARLREELAWYGEQARLARLIHSEGDKGRHALDNDGGARAALAEKEEK